MAVAMPRTRPVVIAGDFNCLTEVGDKINRGQMMGLDRSSRLLKELVCDHSLVDIGKEAQRPRGNFTSVNPLEQMRSRTDFIFLSKGWMVVKVECAPVFFLDCLLLVLTLRQR